MKRVFLVGDSIRMGYQDYVKQELHGLAEVLYPEANCGFAKLTLWNINDWVHQAGGNMDIIHWNNGIWDAFYRMPDMGIFSSVEQYIHDVERTLKQMRKYAPVVLWASTTFVHPDFADCHNADIDERNAAANALMQRENIPITDLNTVVRDNWQAYLHEDKLHLSEAGGQACGKAVTAAICKFL